MFLLSPSQFQTVYFIGYDFTEFICFDRFSLRRFFSFFALLKYFVVIPLAMTTDLMTMTQLVEWIAMIYLIDTQKNRSVEQIMTDCHNENMRKSILESRLEESDAVTFRRREIRLV